MQDTKKLYRLKDTAGANSRNNKVAATAANTDQTLLTLAAAETIDWSRPQKFFLLGRFLFFCKFLCYTLIMLTTLIILTMLLLSTLMQNYIEFLEKRGCLVLLQIFF